MFNRVDDLVVDIFPLYGFSGKTVPVTTWRHILNDFAASSTLSIQIWHHPFCYTLGLDFTEVEPVVVTSGLPSTIVSGHVDSYARGMEMHPTFPELTPYYFPYQVHQNGYSLAGSDKPSYESRPNLGDVAQPGGLPQVDRSRCAYKSCIDQVEGPGLGSHVAKYLSGSSNLEGGKSFFEPHLRIASSYCPTIRRFCSTSGCKGESFKNYAKPTAIAVVKSPFAAKEFAVVQSDCVSSDVVSKSEDSAKFDSFNLESPQLPIIDDCQIGDIGRTHSCFARSLLTRMADNLDLKPNEIDVLDQLLFSKFAPEALCNLEKLSNSPDIHNSAVDSPC
ncbi:hypothetical protein Nepgr_003382 [Nepenthes gracilis]|uniref:Uncharacterized protein n=1 Tax=Nepenthes gracilis TaxID=150966 RepID=A0AAD3XDH9_NEPGR|nr:hypothetical protein Nepgr_003382 [Nepenthes gracilis]